MWYERLYSRASEPGDNLSEEEKAKLADLRALIQAGVYGQDYPDLPDARRVAFVLWLMEHRGAFTEGTESKWD